MQKSIGENRRIDSLTRPAANHQNQVSTRGISPGNSLKGAASPGTLGLPARRRTRDGGPSPPSSSNSGPYPTNRTGTGATRPCSLAAMPTTLRQRADPAYPPHNRLEPPPPPSKPLPATPSLRVPPPFLPHFPHEAIFIHRGLEYFYPLFSTRPSPKLPFTP